MRRLTPGQIVFVSHHSQRSYLLHRKFQKYNSAIVCACRYKRNIPLIVDSQYDDGTVILIREKPKQVAVAFVDDLEPMYEAASNG
jgi:hypothetical protein